MRILGSVYQLYSYNVLLLLQTDSHRQFMRQECVLILEKKMLHRESSSGNGLQPSFPDFNLRNLCLYPFALIVCLGRRNKEIPPLKKDSHNFFCYYSLTNARPVTTDEQMVPSIKPRQLLESGLWCSLTHPNY